MRIQPHQLPFLAQCSKKVNLSKSLNNLTETGNTIKELACHVNNDISVLTSSRIKTTHLIC